MKLNDKTIVITGAARGLGAAIARGVAAKGANLALVDLDVERLSGIKRNAANLALPCVRMLLTS